MRIRKRDSFSHLVLGGERLRQEVLDWKKSGNDALRDGETPGGPPALTGQRELLADIGIDRIDIVTVPPPSFHEYEIWYPAIILAEQMTEREIQLLWPERYDKQRKMWQANIDKEYDPPVIDVEGKFVLILDDIATTGNTMTAACMAVAKAGGYPVAVAAV